MPQSDQPILNPRHQASFACTLFLKQRQLLPITLMSRNRAFGRATHGRTSPEPVRAHKVRSAGTGNPSIKGNVRRLGETGMGTSNGYRNWAKGVLLAAGALGLVCGARSSWAGGTPYLQVIGPAPMRFISIPGKPLGDSLIIDNDTFAESVARQPVTKTSSKDESAPNSNQPNTETIATPDAELSTSSTLTIPIQPGLPPAVSSASTTNAVPTYEFVWPDSSPVGSTSPPPGSVTNPTSPASEMLFVTPQMLVEFFKPLPGSTNTGPVRVIVPVDIGFQPPLGQPTPSSQAIYRSP